MPFVIRTEQVFVLSLIVFTTALFILPDSFISPDHGGTVLTITTFLFGIIAGFYIVVTTTDYNSIKNVLAVETAKLISLYQNVRLYDLNASGSLAERIDEYVRRNFDYEVIEYAHVTHIEFDSIVREIQVLPLMQDNSWLREKIQEILGEIITTRQQLTVLGTKTLSTFQWAVLYILGGLLILSLYGLRTGELFFDIVTVSISCAVVLVLFLIRDLDLYTWNEKTFSIDTFENVLLAIGKLPYYPSELIQSGRVSPEDEQYRVGVLTGGPHHERTIEVRSS